jgi:uncharacterized protein YdcH (DUF465 family)
MPCSSDGYDVRIEEERLKELKQTEAAFCAIMEALERHNSLDNWMHVIDWVKAGTTQADFLNVWISHRRRDAIREERRRAEQEATSRKMKQRHDALAKLTDEDCIALGIQR